MRNKEYGGLGVLVWRVKVILNKLASIVFFWTKP